jgi:uncharacterized protein YbaA (DUF1428 family)
MYISGFLIPVPKNNKDAYRKMAEDAVPLFKEYGAIEMVEGWGEDVRDGEVTDFRRAVKATDDETVVFSWIIWPDKETSDRAEKAMMSDDRMKPPETPPFDMKRMIFGGFAPIVTMGR